MIKKASPAAMTFIEASQTLINGRHDSPDFRFNKLFRLFKKIRAGRLVSALLSLSLTVTSTAFAVPPVQELPSANLSSVFLAPVISQINPEVIRFEKTYVPDRCLDRGQYCPVVIYVQDAHANPEAQKHIQQLVENLSRHLAHFQIAVESADGPLHSELFNFGNENSEIRKKVIETLAEQGELTGAELFFLDSRDTALKASSQIPVVGVEDKQLFLQNLVDFKVLLENRGAIDKAFSRLNALLIKTKSLYFSPTLKKFDDEHKANSENRRELLARLHVVAEWARSVLGIRLADPAEQLRFPNVTRLLRLGQLEKDINHADAVSEKEKLRAVLSEYADESADVSQLISSLDVLADAPELLKIDLQVSPRLAFEKLEAVSASNRLRLEQYPNFIQQMIFQVLQSEIDAPELFAELDKIENSILDHLAAGNGEKELVQIGRSFKLLEKMLHGEVSRHEADDYDNRKNSLQIAPIADRLFQLNDKAIQDDQFKSDVNLLQRYLNLSHKFYRDAQAREHAIADHALRLLAVKPSSFSNEVLGSGFRPNPNVLTLIAGGFHTEGITQILEQKQIPYIVVAPRMFKPADDTLYARVMLGKNQEFLPASRQSAQNIFRPLLTSSIDSVSAHTMIESTLRRFASRSELRSIQPEPRSKELSAVLDAFENLAKKNVMRIDFKEAPEINALIEAGKWSEVESDLAATLKQEGYFPAGESPYIFEANVPRVGFVGLDSLAARLITHLAVEGISVSGFDEDPKRVQKYEALIGEELDLVQYGISTQVSFFGQPQGQFFGVPLPNRRKTGLENLLRVNDVIMINIDPTKAGSTREYQEKIYPLFIRLAQALKSVGDENLKTIVFRSIVPFSGDPATLLGSIQNIFDNNGVKNVELVYQPLFLGREPVARDIADEQVVLGTLDGMPSAGSRMLERLYYYKSEERPIKLTDTRNAELAQYFISLYISKKISSINQLTKLVQKVGGDLNAIALIAGLDSRILTNYTQAGLGFKGWLERISKVVLERIEIKEQQLPPGVQKLVFGKLKSILNHVLKINQSQSDLLKTLIIKNEGSVQNKSAIFFGFSNKPSSKYFQDSQSTELLRWLKANNLARATIVDPYISPEYFKEWKAKLLAEDPSYAAISLELVTSLQELKTHLENEDFLVDFSVIGMNHEEIKNLPPSFFQETEKLQGKPLYDGWNIYGLQANGVVKHTLQEVREAGLNYFGLSRAGSRAGLSEIPMIESRLYERLEDIPVANDLPDELPVTVMGTGYVGLIQSTLLAGLGWQVTGVDINEEKIRMLNAGKSPIYEPGLSELLAKYLRQTLRFSKNVTSSIRKSSVVFVAVGTPSDENGEIDLSQVLSAAESFGKVIASMKNRLGKIELKDRKILVIKSTVTPDVFSKIIKLLREKFNLELNRDYALGSNPEFLREGSAVNDVQYPDRIVLAGSDQAAVNILLKLYRPQLEQLEVERRSETGNNIPPLKLVITDLISAPLGKYLANAYLASDISFSNIAARAARFLGADWLEITSIMRRDWRISKSAFLSAGVGYGGSCFPKDVKALLYFMIQNGVPPTFLQEIEDINQWVKQKAFLGEIVEVLRQDEWNSEFLPFPLSASQLAVWGLAFKKDTDDVREAPAFDVVYGLLNAGAKKIKAHDPLPEARRNFIRDIEKVSVLLKADRQGKDSLNQSESFVFKELSKLPKAKLNKYVYLYEALRNGRLEIVEDKYDAAEGSDAIVLLTDWKDYLPNTQYADGVDFHRIKSYFGNQGKNPVLIAGRDLYNAFDMARKGFLFYSVSQLSVGASLSSYRSELRTHVWQDRGYRIISIGGNSLAESEDDAGEEHQRENLKKTFTPEVVESIKSGAIITHGNGPQVGLALMRYGSESISTSRKLEKYNVVEQTQKETGNLIRAVLLERGIPAEKIQIVITHVLVDLNDPDFENPTKPIGIKPKNGPDTREKVPSPKPLGVVEIEEIARAVKEGKIVIAVGGGGIPVDQEAFQSNGHSIEVVGAVVDKDLATARLARELRKHGINVSDLIIATGEQYVYSGYGTETVRPLYTLTPRKIDELLTHDKSRTAFPDGRIRPKIIAAADFIDYGGSVALITTPENILKPTEGTLVVKHQIRSELRHVVSPPSASKLKNIKLLDPEKLEWIGVKNEAGFIQRVTILTQMAQLAKIFSLPVNQDGKKSANVFWSVQGSQMTPSANSNTSDWRIEYYIHSDSMAIDVTVSYKEAGRWRKVATADTTLNELKELAAGSSAKTPVISKIRQLSFSDFVTKVMNLGWPSHNVNSTTFLAQKVGKTTIEAGFDYASNGAQTQILSIWFDGRPKFEFFVSRSTHPKTIETTAERVRGAASSGNHLINFEFSEASKKLFIEVTEEMFMKLQSSNQHYGRTKDGVAWEFRPVALGNYEPAKRSELRIGFKDAAEELQSILGASRQIGFVPTDQFMHTEHAVLSADLSRIGVPNAVLYALAFPNVQKPQPVVGQVVKVIDAESFDPDQYESAMSDLIDHGVKLVLAVQNHNPHTFKAIKNKLNQLLIKAAQDKGFAPDDVINRVAVESLSAATAQEIQKLIATRELINTSAVISEDSNVLESVRSALRFLDDTHHKSELSAVALREVVKAVTNPKAVQNRFGVISLSDWLSAKLTAILGERQAAKSA